MAVSLKRVRGRVQDRIRDTDDRNPTFTPFEIDNAICDQYLNIASRLPVPDLYTASAFTIAAGGDTFQLPATVSQYTGNDGGAEYAAGMRIRLTSNGQFLRKSTVEELDSFRDGNQTIHLGVPDKFCLWEEKDQDVQGRCYPGATAAQVCDLWAPLMPDDLRDFVGSGAEGMDTVEVLFARSGILGLVMYTAADLVARMTDSDLTLRKINPGVVNLWREEANIILNREAGRRHNIDDVGRLQRWRS